MHIPCVMSYGHMTCRKLVRPLMFTLEFDSKEPTQKLTEFINSCENKFSKFWDDCPRVDWMLWVLHNKIRYRDTGKILKFAKSLNQEPEETIVVEPELS